jgi:hypothetical protein
MCTNNNDIAAGVTPDTRDACPRVLGIAMLNFCLTSWDKPGTS